MNSLTKFLLLFLVVGLLLPACDQENIDEIVEIEDPNYQPETVEVNNLVNALQVNTNQGLDLGCITLQFPFDMLTESNETVTISSEFDFETAINEPSPNIVVDFVYPINIADEEGNISEVNNNDELGLAFVSCIPDTDWEVTEENEDLIPAFLFEELCFDLIFPVNLEDEDGDTYTANNESELIDLAATVEHLFFVLPLTIEYEDGSQLVIDSDDNFFDAVFLCEGATPPVAGGGFVIQGFGCNELLYPFDVENEAGETVTINDANAYADLVLSGAEIILQFPFSLSNPEGEVSVITNIDDLITALNACGGFFIEIGTSDLCDTDAHVLLFFNAHNIFTVFDCPFAINYPVDVTVDGTPVTLNSVDDYFAETGAPFSFGDVDLIYPINVTVEADGSTVELNADEEVCAFIEACE